MKSSIKLIKEHPKIAESLLSALRYNGRLVLSASGGRFKPLGHL